MKCRSQGTRAHPVTEAPSQALEEVGVPVGQPRDDQLPRAVDDADGLLPEVTQVGALAESDDAVTGDGHGAVFDDPAPIIKSYNNAALDHQIASGKPRRVHGWLRGREMIAHMMTIDVINGGYQPKVTGARSTDRRSERRTRRNQEGTAFPSAGVESSVP